MRSTGEVLGLSSSYGEAFCKAQEATKVELPMDGTVLISVNRRDKEGAVEVAKMFHENGFDLVATEHTAQAIENAGIPVKKVKKMYEGRPNVYDIITNKSVAFVINSPNGKDSVHDDSYLRKAAVKAKVPYMTTIAAAKASAIGIAEMKKKGKEGVKSLQEYHAEITEK